MLRLARYLIGYVEFTFTDGFCAGFLSDCLEQRYNISEIREENGALTAACPAGLYPFLRPLARRHGGRLRVLKKYGLVFRLAPLRHRAGLFCGALAAVCLICLLTSFVWKVEVKGSTAIPKAQVLVLMEENGLRAGVPKRSVEKGRLASLMMAAYPDCAYAHINENGCTFTVELADAVRKPKADKAKRYSNVKAKKDGVIVRVTVKRGWQTVQKGEAVTAGTLLISGVFESEKKMNLYAHASGEVLAEVKEPVHLVVSRLQREQVYFAENTYRYLSFFSLKIPLFIGKEGTGDRTETADYLRLNNQELPIGIIRATVRPYTVKERRLTDSELQALAEAALREKLETEFAGATLLQKQLKTALGADGITVSGNVLLLENIGEEVKIIP